MDSDLTDVSASELMKWGLANLQSASDEADYAVRHSRLPVRDYPPSTDDLAPDPRPRDDFFERAFPVLYPYGEGGMEAARPVHMSLAAHARWALQYHDRRFRLHDHFSFVVFGILQRRTALAAARVQMNSVDFEKHARVLRTITPDMLAAAIKLEEKNAPQTDPSILLLMRQLRSASGRVTASDQSRTCLRSQMWSTALVKGPSTLWLTANPACEHDPIVQVLCGEDINLDDFVRTDAPPSAQRSMNVAKDPYASAKYFHTLIAALLKHLFGVSVQGHAVHSEIGVLGEVAAYFGTVETQGRGSLHLHMLVWLKNTPSSTELQSLLRSDAFRQKVAAFIKRHIRGYLPGLESADSVRALPSDGEIACSRPVNAHPDNHSYALQSAAFELQLATSAQVHSCTVAHCLTRTKHGVLRCKRKAPWPTSAVDSIDEQGHWACKREYAFINPWNPAVLLNLRCNNDMKLLTNGEDTKNITFYVTSYIAKKQSRTFNLMAVLAEGYAYDLKYPISEHLEDVRENGRLLLFRLLNQINRQQEIAAPMVMSYLMGWGDTFCSHTYTPLYWSRFARALFTTFPALKRSSS